MTVVALGMPLFNRADFLPQALESLLAQTSKDFVLALVDDGSNDASPDIAQEYAQQDSRVAYFRNARRVGMLENWRRAYLHALDLAPEARWFAWTSDHDLWEPRWLEALVSVLESSPDAVLAYPLNVRISANGEQILPAWTFGTTGVSYSRARLRCAVRGMSAGDMVYGLFRRDVLERCGVFRSTLLPDRLLLAEAALEGEFVQVPEILWRRRFAIPFTLDRQRTALFAGSPPGYARLPWWVVHGVLIARARGTLLALDYLAFSAPVVARGRLRKAIKSSRLRRFRPLIRRTSRLAFKRYMRARSLAGRLLYGALDRTTKGDE